LTFRDLNLNINPPYTHTIMSDIEDQMDVDAPKEVQFSSDNASGKKRTAADLPVEALDNLPWYGIVALFWRKESH
jgi:hypothetical protein